MTQIKNISLTLILTVALTGCSNLQSSNKQQTGGFLGSIVGGILGSNVGSGKGQLAAIIGGTMLGSHFGSSVGKSLDRADQAYIYRAQSTAFTTPIGHQINWHNPQSGHSGSIIPVRDGSSVRGEHCREFQQTIYIDGNQHQAHGSACRQSDGTWRIVN